MIVYLHDESRWYISTGEISFFKQIQYSKAPLETNVLKVRKYLYGTNPQDLYTLNNLPTMPQTIIVPNWSSADTSTYTLNTASSWTPNQNGRFTYLVAKSSAQQTTTDTTGNAQPHATNDKIIVPLFTGQENQIIDSLVNFDIKQTYKSLVNADAESIGFYECEYPISQLIG